MNGHTIASFIFGFFVGGFIGWGTALLMVWAGRESDREERARLEYQAFRKRFPIIAAGRAEARDRFFPCRVAGCPDEVTWWEDDGVKRSYMCALHKTWRPLE